MRQFIKENPKISLAVVLICLATLISWLLSRYISPAPPKTLIFTAGAADGAYYKYAQRYQTILAKEGITLDVRTSAGSVENIQRLTASHTEFLAGFVQGGLGANSRQSDKESDSFDDIQTLANVAYEPVWIFTLNPKIKDLSELKGLRVAIGAEGGGTRMVALDLLQGVGLKSFEEKWLPLGGSAAAKALLDKQVDAVIVVASTEAASVQQLIHVPNVHIVDLMHANALSRLYPYLQTIRLPQGVLDLPNNIPAKDTTLLATSANLVVGEKVHPALAYLLLDAAAHVHNTGGALHSPGDFPHTKGADYPISEESKRYFTTGKPFLQRYMPFWAANFLQRLLLILIPLVAIVLPVIKLIPALINFQQERKLFNIYHALHEVERDIKSNQDKDAITIKLTAIDGNIKKAKFAKVFADRVYTLRQHVDFVRDNLNLL
jgi:TRAP transporter TAXI family solute receptor